MNAVDILTGARLHFGLIAVNPAEDLQFGGIGLMVDAPGFAVRVEAAESDFIEADETTRKRISDVLARYRQSVAGHAVPACRIRVERTIPGHAGFGSGTQTDLAIGRALAEISGEPELSAVEISRRTGRGQRSSIGTYGFDLGGFLVDGGKSRNEAVSLRVESIAFPEEWRFVAVTPNRTSGPAGTRERNAFAALEPMARSVTQQLRELIETKIVPSIETGRFDDFAPALEEFGTAVGRYFASVQGGVYASPAMSEFAETLRARGVGCIAQSSWGPTVCIPCRDQDEVDRVLNVSTQMTNAEDCSVRVLSAKNEGASVRTEAVVSG